MIEIDISADKATWDEAVLEQGGHPLQLWGWGEVKAAHGWRADRVMIKEQGEVIGLAQLLIRRLPRPFGAFVYVPRGPICKPAKRQVVLEELAKYTRATYQPVVLSLEPDTEAWPLPAGWRVSSNTVLAPRTIILDLNKSEEELLAHMTKKTRQYIRKSASDVTVRRVKSSEELGECLKIYKETAQRAGFALHDDEYYLDIFDKMGDFSPVFAAFHGEKMVAFLWLAISGEVAFELYGGVTDEGQALRANYTLKWQAIHAVKKWGVARYDLNGLINDGISTFKQGFSDHENQLVGTYDYPLSPLYLAWTRGLPAAKKIVRRLRQRA